MYKFNKLLAPAYSLPLAGGGRGVERRMVLRDSTLILPFPLPGGRNGKEYAISDIWLILPPASRPRSSGRHRLFSCGLESFACGDVTHLDMLLYGLG